MDAVVLIGLPLLYFPPHLLKRLTYSSKELLHTNTQTVHRSTSKFTQAHGGTTLYWEMHLHELVFVYLLFACVH